MSDSHQVRSTASDSALDWLAELRDVARELLTERQYEVWRLLTKERNAMQIAQYLRVSLRTVRYEIKALREILEAHRETIASGPIRLGLSMEASGNRVRWGRDRTLEGVDRRMLREVKRDGRLPRGLVFSETP